MQEPTAQQQKVLDYITEFLEQQGYPPSLREIGRALGLASVNAVRGHVLALERKGFLQRDNDKARTLRITRQPSALSRFKEKLHEMVRTDEGVLQHVVYAIVWATREARPRLDSDTRQGIEAALEAEAVEHGWRILERRFGPEHVAVVVAVWASHSPQQAARRLMRAARRQMSAGDDRPWAQGFGITTNPDDLDELIQEYLQRVGAAGE